jgi:hypothetical protein
MYKKLPNFIKIFLFIFIFVYFLGFLQPVFAQVSVGSPTVSPSPVADGTWVQDEEVTFVGKSAARANDFLQWTLEKDNYQWIHLLPGTSDPIEGFWVTVRNIVFALLALFVLGSAFVMIITRGQNLTIMRFIPRFIIILLLVVFSYAIVRFLYQATDVIQGFFLNISPPGKPIVNIGPKDLLSIAFNYTDFIGYRLVGFQYDESAFISLLLVKLTAITYYVMTGILLIRKIILWFFIIVSPIFPLLLFFRPVRNTAKIWVGEFFRWLLYAPLFALFLHGLVKVWQSGIPMFFNNFTGVGGPATYPTAINILLGGPGQVVSQANSVNLSTTFALYVVSLLMLWVVILLPFLLLQIFLDYLNNVSLGENPMVKKLTSQSWFNRAYGGVPPAPGKPPQSPSPFGVSKAIPFLNKRAMEIPNSAATSTLERATLSNIQSIRETKDVLKLANLSIPKMRDIARYETSMTRHDTVSKAEISRFHDTLEKISKPTTASQPQDRAKFSSIKEKLVQQQKGGDKLADNVLSASKASEQINDKTKAVIPGQKQHGMTNIKDIKLPQANTVQQVSIEEYEDVKKMWQENYQNMETPVGPNGQPTDKSTFLKNDIDNITETINLLSSTNQEDVDRGMERVANILPFLLLGGFSKTEVVSYLKAKLEAAKSVVASLSQKQEEEDTMVDREEGTKEEHQEMVMRQEIDPDDEKPQNAAPSEVPGEGGLNIPENKSQEPNDNMDNGNGGQGGTQA